MLNITTVASPISFVPGANLDLGLRSAVDLDLDLRSAADLALDLENADLSLARNLARNLALTLDPSRDLDLVRRRGHDQGASH